MQPNGWPFIRNVSALSSLYTFHHANLDSLLKQRSGKTHALCHGDRTSAVAATKFQLVTQACHMLPIVLHISYAIGMQWRSPRLCNTGTVPETVRCRCNQVEHHHLFLLRVQGVFCAILCSVHQHGLP